MYVVGAPIEEPPDFYGRGELLAALLGGRDRLVFLMGLRRTGKTSVLKALERRAEGAGLLPLFLQLQAADEGLRDLVADAVDALAFDQGEEIDEDVLDAAPLGRLLKLADRLAGRKKRELLVLIDEAEVLVRLCEAGPESEAGREVARLRSWLSGPRRKRAVMAGGRYALRLAETGNLGDGDPFLAGFTRRLLDPVLGPAEAADLARLSRRGGEGAARLGDEAVAAIVARTGGHPFLIQSACLELRERGGAVDAALAAVLSTYAANWAFFDDLQRTARSERRVLGAIAQGAPVPERLAAFQRSLVQAGLLHPTGALRVPLLAAYLRGKGWGPDGAWAECPERLTDAQAVPGATPVAQDTGAEVAIAGGTQRLILNRFLGGGAFGEVYAARLLGEADFERTVAVKILLHRWQHQPEIVARMRDEARILGRLRHHAIVRVDQLFDIRGRTAVMMEYVEGVDLLDLLRSEAVPAAAAAQITAEVASALRVAWEGSPGGEALRVTHRDIKPGNLRLTPYGRVKVLDFGIARAEFAGREAITEVLTPGTPSYLAPERHRGQHDDPASDIYSLGLVLLEMLTGAHPGPLPGDAEGHRAGMAPALEALDDAPPALAALARQMLAFEPADRPVAAEVARACWAASPPGEDLRTWAARVVPAHCLPDDAITGEEPLPGLGAVDMPTWKET